MTKISIYLPRDVEERVRLAAKAKKQSLSKWIAEQIGSNLVETWPREIVDAAGAFPDFPAVEKRRKGYGRDSRRGSNPPARVMGRRFAD